MRCSHLWHGEVRLIVCLVSINIVAETDPESCHTTLGILPLKTAYLMHTSKRGGQGSMALALPHLCAPGHAKPHMLTLFKDSKSLCICETNAQLRRLLLSTCTGNVPQAFSLLDPHTESGGRGLLCAAHATCTVLRRLSPSHSTAKDGQGSASSPLLRRFPERL